MWQSKFTKGWSGERFETVDIKVKRVVKIKSKLEWFYKGKLVLWNKSRK